MPDNYVILNRYENLIEANLDASKLESEGISVFISDEIIGGLNFLYGQAVGNIKLLVRKKDLRLAKNIVKG